MSATNAVHINVICLLIDEIHDIFFSFTVSPGQIYCPELSSSVPEVQGGVGTAVTVDINYIFLLSWDRIRGMQRHTRTASPHHFFLSPLPQYQPHQKLYFLGTVLKCYEILIILKHACKSITCFMLYYAEDQISFRNVCFASVIIIIIIYIIYYYLTYIYLSIVETTATVTPT